MLSLDSIRCLGLSHLILDNNPTESGRSRTSSVQIPELSGLAVSAKDSSLAALDSYLLVHNPLACLSFEFFPRVDRVSFKGTDNLASLIDAVSLVRKTETDQIKQLYPSILLARASLISGISEDSIRILDPLVLFVDSNNNRDLDKLVSNNAGSMYGNILYLMAACTLGEAYFLQSEPQKAISCLELGVSFIERKLYIPPSISSTANSGLKKLLQTESEDQNESQIIHYARQYSLGFAQYPATYRSINRATVIRLYLNTLVQSTPTLKNSASESVAPICSTPVLPFKNTPSPFSGVSRAQIIYPPDIPISIAIEFQSLLPLYESLVVQNCNFPRLARSEHEVFGEETLSFRHERVLELFEWIGIIEFCGDSSANGGVSEAVERGYKVVEAMYRATLHSFQNIKMIRHLCHSFASLIGHLCDSASESEVSEALLAFKKYFNLYEKRRQEAVADATHHHKEFDGKIENENVADAVGVLISGARLCLTWFNSENGLNNQQLEQARSYIEFALEIVLKDGAKFYNSQDTNSLLVEVHKYKGLIFGELAAEVVNSTDRRSFQEAALKSFKESISRVDSEKATNWRLFYQLAFQYAEMGQIADAVASIQESLNLDPTNISSWNLLALLLTSVRQYDEALEVCEAGWRIGVDNINGKLSNEASTKIKIEDELIIVWDSVPVKVKEDLFNLKLTQLSIITKFSGSKSGLDALQPLFSLFSQMFNPLLKSLDPLIVSTTVAVTPIAYSYASSEASSPKEPHQGNSSGDVKHSRATTSTNTGGLTAVGYLPYFGYSFGLCDMQICLWTTAAKLYTNLRLFVDADLALTEAESLAQVWITIDQKVRSRDSMLFKDSAGILDGTNFGDIQIPLPAKKVQLLRRRSIKTTSGAGKSNDGVNDLDKKWNVSDSGLRRVLADISFGNAFLKVVKFQSSLLPAKLSSFAKYLPASITTSISIPFDEHPRKTSVHSTFTVNHSSSSSSLTRPISIKGSTASMGSLAVGGVEAGIGRSSPASFNSNTPKSNPRLESNSEKEEDVSLESLIADLHICLALDDEHLPARVELAKIYFQSADSFDGASFSEAEYWFERACKRSKLRGSGGGSRGLSTHFGGLTSEYGVECWAGLGQTIEKTCLDENGKVDASRLNSAKDCLLFAVQMERGAAVRGFQCLRRFCD
ncbi:hypothetical protein HK100_001312 [Physocladia obscura]|uniref:Uncharacterized protein n=1 Tax=Physocladia obscura TaxID=109957 RepID=A0AAD5XBX7_9FUNG|nr:hypothetical protein HK100_001312 [Physocladia obscura]